MILAKALTILLVFSPAAHSRKAEIFCKSKTALADAGAIIEIEKQDDGGFNYTFTKNSFAGPRVAAQFPVTVEATKPGKSGCELDITKNADGSHRFFVAQKAGDKWKMIFPKGQPDGELQCEVKESLREKLCLVGPSAEPVHPPALCDEANADSPLCSGASQAD